MELRRCTQELEFKWKDVTFKIKAKATRGDQYEMHASMAGDVSVEDGKIIKAKPSHLFPWLIEHFVTGWHGVVDEHGKPVPWALKNLYDLPAEPGEDLILILGSYILNHTGVAPAREADERKKDLSPA